MEVRRSKIEDLGLNKRKRTFKQSTVSLQSSFLYLRSSILYPLSSILVLSAITIASAQDAPAELKNKIDASIQTAYQTAVARFPCKIGTRGKPKMLRWEQVDRCLNDAAGRVNWEGLRGRLAELRKEFPSVGADAFASTLEASLSAYAVAYDRVFVVKDPETLVPLTNSLLKFLPSDSLLNLPVYDKAGTQVGTFLGTYSYERTGGLASANKYSLALFQYADRNGNVQPAADKLLLDSFGVPWKEAQAQKGFRLPRRANDE